MQIVYAAYKLIHRRQQQPVTEFYYRRIIPDSGNYVASISREERPQPLKLTIIGHSTPKVRITPAIGQLRRILHQKTP